MLVWLTLPFYDFCGFRSVAVNSVYKLQFFTFITFNDDDDDDAMARVHPVHLTNADSAPRGRRSLTYRANRLVRRPRVFFYRPQPPSPFIITSQPGG